MSNWEGFYSTQQVSRLAGIPKGTLYYWKKQGVIAPSVQIVNANGNVEEGYSYTDLAIIKVLHALRIRKLNLRSAVLTFQHLYERFGTPSGDGWLNTHVYVIDKDVFAQKPDNWDTTLATKGGQRAQMQVLGELVEEEGALLVPKKYTPHIEIDPNVMDGEPVIKNTRVPTSLLATLADQGMAIPELANLYYPISTTAIECAIAFEKDIEERYSKAITKARTAIN